MMKREAGDTTLDFEIISLRNLIRAALRATAWAVWD